MRAHTPRAENLLAQEKLRWLDEGNARKCPWKFGKSCQPAASQSTRLDRRQNGSAVSTRSIANGVLRAYAVITHAPHAFSLNFSFSTGCASPRRGNVISSPDTMRAGRNDPILPLAHARTSRFSNVKTCARYFYLRIKLSVPACFIVRRVSNSSVRAMYLSIVRIM